MKYMLLIGFFVSGCASLKPIDEKNVAVSKELDQKTQKKFTIEEKATKKMVVIKPDQTVKSNKATKVVTETKVVEQERKFKPDIGEQLTYAVYGPMGVRAGTLIAKVVGEKTINDQLVIHLKANVYNASFFASIFKVNLLIESFVNPYEFKSLRYQISGQEGPISKQNVELYDYESNQIIETKEQKTDEGVKVVNKQHPVLTTNTAQDILSSFYKVRAFDFKTPEMTFYVASGSKLKQAKVVKLKEESWEGKECIVAGLAFEPGQSPEKHQIWLDKNTHKIYQIQADMKWGSFKILLEE